MQALAASLRVGFAINGKKPLKILGTGSVMIRVFRASGLLVLEGFPIICAFFLGFGHFTRKVSIEFIALVMFMFKVRLCDP